MRLRRLVNFVVVGLIGLSFAGCGNPGKKGMGRDVVISVLVDKAVKSSLEQYLDMSGELSARDEVKIYPEVPGKVANIVRLEGAYVYRGQAIMYIDRFQVGASYALSPVISPIDGYVTRLLVTRGQNVSPGVPLASVGNIYQIDALINIPERDINDVQIGQKVYITVPANPGKTNIGEIYRRDYAVDPSSHTLLVRAKVDNTGKELLPGMYADTSIFIRSAKDVFVLPNSAIFNREGKSYVYVNVNGKAFQREVEVMFSYKDKMAVSSKVEYAEVTNSTATNQSPPISKGLLVGEEVVTFGREFLKNGSKINPIRESDEEKMIQGNISSTNVSVETNMPPKKPGLPFRKKSKKEEKPSDTTNR